MPSTLWSRCTCDDSSWQCDLVDRDGNPIDYVERILEHLPEKYRDHLVTLKHDNWISYSYVPVFDTDTQAMWDKELSDFYDQIINGDYGTIIPHFTPWLTPDQARKAVEIAREEMIEKACEYIDGLIEILNDKIGYG